MQSLNVEKGEKRDGGIMLSRRDWATNAQYRECSLGVFAACLSHMAKGHRHVLSWQIGASVRCPFRHRQTLVVEKQGR